jgi:hypothetical protein
MRSATAAARGALPLACITLLLALCTPLVTASVPTVAPPAAVTRLSQERGGLGVTFGVGANGMVRERRRRERETREEEERSTRLSQTSRRSPSPLPVAPHASPHTRPTPLSVFF